MSEELLNEIRKLEVRLQEFVEAERKAIESLRRWINTLRELHNSMSKIEEKIIVNDKRDFLRKIKNFSITPK